jgi:hypothetical protein
MATKAKNQATETNKPAAVFRARGIKVSVFANTGDNGAFYKATLQRIYKQGEERKTTGSLGRDDLPIAQYLLGKAWEFILQAESKETKDAD